MRELFKRVERLEAQAASAKDLDRITHFVIKPMEADGSPWNPNWCGADDGGEIWRRDDESPEQFEARAKATFPKVGRMSRLIWIGRNDA